MAGALRPLCLVLALLSAAPALRAEEAGPGKAPVPVLTLDQDRLFVESAWGKRVLAEIETASRDLQAENRKIEAALIEEEKTLTERRKQLPAEEFRSLSDEFDKRVTGIRQAQDAKAQAISDQRDRERQAFFTAAVPFLRDVLLQRGAVAIMDSRAVLMSVDALDATDDIRRALDEKLGAGPAPVAP